MEQTCRVAIAHWNAQTRNALHAAVSGLGHEVCIHASTGRELIDLALSQRPDLCIVQEFLPDMTGMQAVRDVSGDEAIPIIVVVGGEDGELQQPNATNVMGVLGEPVRPADLIPVIPLALCRFAALASLRESVDLLTDKVRRKA